MMHWCLGFMMLEQLLYPTVGTHEVKSLSLHGALSLHGSQSRLSCLVTEGSRQTPCSSSLPRNKPRQHVAWGSMHVDTSYVRCGIQWADLKSSLVSPAEFTKVITGKPRPMLNKFISWELKQPPQHKGSRPASSSLKPPWLCCHMALSKVFFCNLAHSGGNLNQSWQGHGKETTFSGKPNT